MKQRTLLYIDPKNTPENVMSSLKISDQDKDTITVSLKKSEALHSIKQVKYSFKSSDCANNNISNLGIFHITWKKKDLNLESPLLNEWNYWMSPDLSINVAPQNALTWHQYNSKSIDFINTLLKFLHIDDSSAPVFEREWWSYHLNIDNIDLNRIVNWLELPNIPIDSSFDSFEIILNNTELDIYTYYTDDNAQSVSISKGNTSEEEFAVISEMSNNKEDLKIDRFVQGLNGKLNKDNGEFQLVPTMFMFSSYATNHHLKFSSVINQSLNAALHPVINYKFTNFDKYAFYPRDDDSILDYTQCSLNLKTVLSNDYIVDRYEIERLISNSNNQLCIDHINYVSNNGMDLELPSYKISEWGSIISLQLNQSCISLNNGEFNLPIHIRYTLPTLNGDYTTLPNPSSAVYWNCPLTDEALDQISKSFYTDNGRFQLIEENERPLSRNYYLEQEPTTYSVSMPAGETRFQIEIDIVTATVVLAGALFLWRCCVHK